MKNTLEQNQKKAKALPKADDPGIDKRRNIDEKEEKSIIFDETKKIDTFYFQFLHISL